MGWAVAQLAVGAAGSELIARLGQNTPAESSYLGGQPSGNGAEAPIQIPA